MNLLGSIGGGYFAFALNSKRQAAPNVRRLGRLAISSVPLTRASVVRQLGENHYRESICWDQLPFSTKRSSGLSIPVPDFAIRVQELQVLQERPLGSHTCFLAQIVGEQTHSAEPEFHMIHGFYAAYRRDHSQAGLVWEGRSDLQLQRVNK
jgi:flavin reductase (DIM6/NTAB) family NADH-FMN oxidoreductase RutF